MISGYLGDGEDFDHAIADFAIAYADQNEQDYRRLLQAVSDARVLATVGQVSSPSPGEAGNRRPRWTGITRGPGSGEAPGFRLPVRARPDGSRR